MIPKNKSFSAQTARWAGGLGALLLCIALVGVFSGYSFIHIHAVPYSTFRNDVSQGNVAEITVTGNNIDGTFKHPVTVGSGKHALVYKEFLTTIPSFGDQGLMELLKTKGVVVNAQPSMNPWLIALLIGVVPWFLIFVGFFVYSNKRARGMNSGIGGTALGFGKSKAKLYRKSSSKITFKEVAGLGNTKKELSEIIDFLKEPSKYLALGGKLPKGVLLSGPPGTGKTLMARAVAGEANVPFYSTSGSEFVEMFVGVGASRVRDMFENAKKDAPAIIYIDEIDSIGRMRGAGLGGGHDEREQTLNQILSEMDGFSPQLAVVVMASTNRPDILDPALIRPGRFDRRVVLDLPLKQARKEILQVHVRNVPLADDVDLAAVANRTVGFSGADLMNLVNEAALLAARNGKKKVSAEDFDQSRDKILMGVEREDLINEKEKKIVAYHEAGHALVARMIPGVDPLQKVSIIPRGHALGMTEIVPEEDRHNLSRTYLLNRIAVMLGGCVAEQIVFQDFTTGAGDDLKQSTQLARRMVCQWGMSEKLGLVSFPHGEEQPFLGRNLAEPKDFSEHTAQLIDEEVRRIMRDMEQIARDVLGQNRDKLDILAQELLERETLTRQDLNRLLGLGPKAAEADGQ